MLTRIEACQLTLNQRNDRLDTIDLTVVHEVCLRVGCKHFLPQRFPIAIVQGVCVAEEDVLDCTPIQNQSLIHLTSLRDYLT